MTTHPCTPCATATRRRALAVSLQKTVDHGARSGTSVLCTWVLVGVNPQRITSAKFMSLRAPIINAPMIAIRINPYIASAERRVNIHIIISKLRPRFERGRVPDLVVAMLTSQCSAHDNEDSNSEKGDEDRPLHPDRFALVY